MSQQFIEQFTVPASSPYTYTVKNPTSATLVQVQSAAGVVVTGCSLSGGVLTVPAGEAGAVLWVIYDATPTASYAGSQAQAGRGTIISIAGTVIGEVSDSPLTRGKWETADVTNFESGSDSEFITTIRKPGTLTVKGNRVASDAGQQAVETAYQNGTIAAFAIQLPKTASQSTQGDKYSFNALVVGSSFTISPTKQVEFDIELQISGATTFTAGS